MAGRKLKFKAKLKASSILEVVIAMVVIVTVFTIAMMIFTNVQRSSLSVKKIKAQRVLQDALLVAEKMSDISKQSFVIDDVRVDEEISEYNNVTNLHLVTLIAYDQNQEKIAEVKEVVNANK
ncbi:hypothetical protein KXQ82_10415 [Mucilaginibacter sp. HMF5004]|uniref:hypothetical protein n=1 Tax=Mucilaginibacter rivuli TaxID=2857527 RepID=UPI001C5F738F|nr:hypothetical protein [Mucilaginibacter rivuli]MBW4890132.1 hypothetical protein [Mucilaginibacter rivuli]